MKFLNSAIILNLNYNPNAFLARPECESNILGSAKRNWISLVVEIHCLATVSNTHTLLILVRWDLRLYMTWHDMQPASTKGGGTDGSQSVPGPDRLYIGCLSQKAVQNNTTMTWKEMKHSKTMLLINLQNCVQLCNLFSGAKTFLHGLGQCFSTAGPRPGTGSWRQL